MTSMPAQSFLSPQSRRIVSIKKMIEKRVLVDFTYRYLINMLSVIDLCTIETSHLLLVPARFSFDDLRVVPVCQHYFILWAPADLQSL